MPTVLMTAPPQSEVPSLKHVQNTRESKGVRVVPPWTLVPLSVVALGSFGLMGISGSATLSAQGRYLDSRSRADYDTGHTLQDRTNLLLGVGIGVTVVTALVALVFTDWNPGPPANLRAFQARGWR